MTRKKVLDLAHTVRIDDTAWRHVLRARDFDLLVSRILDIAPPSGFNGSVFDDMAALRGDFDQVALDLQDVIAYGEKHKRENAG